MVVQVRTIQPLQNTELQQDTDVELTKLASIADSHAFEIWGVNVARGEPFPVADAAGNVQAYVFPYAFGVEVFPADLSLVSFEKGQDERFGAIYVAAKPTRYPVLRVMHRLHPLFNRGEEARRIAQALLDASGVSITRIYWVGMEQEYFEITSEDQSLLLDVNTLRQIDRKTAFDPSISAIMQIDQEETHEILTSPTLMTIEADARALSSELKLIPLAECVPAVNWTWWCVPTAWTMATCYYDNFVKGIGGHTGYGRLVGYWFDHPKSGHNVPDFIDQIIDPATGTWRTGFNGYSDFIQKTYGYSFKTRDVKANAGNDWAWGDITAEIDAGRPFVWGGITPQGEERHGTCAFGYRETANGKFVVLHTTWGDTPQAQRDEWLYTLGDGLTAITPGGGTVGQNLVLGSPDGGETALTNVATPIHWFIWGDQIKIAEISVSTDGGNTWAIVDSSAPCVPGWNTFDWKPNIASDRTRVRVKGNDINGTYIAGDGSHNNVRVLPGPRPVTLKTTLLKTKTDAKGAFSAPHGLERYTPDGYAIRAVSVAVQHKNGNWHTLELSHDIDNRFWWNQNVVAGVIASPHFFERPVQIVVSAEFIAG